MEFFLKKLILSIIYLFLAFLSTLIIKKIFSILLFGAQKTQNQKLIKKTKTLKAFIDSLIYVAVYFVALFFILEKWGVNMTPFLTGAGILGLTFSFGAQSLAKDLISGFFIIFDNQFEVGDYIKVGTLEGKVKKITLRQTILKDKNNNLILIPNSQITSVVKVKKS
jgi:small conductance mechanosensitive channel